MYINEGLTNVDIYCINLRIRHEKRKYMKSQFKRLKLDVKFVTVELNPNPKRGCIESHLSIIRNHYEQKKTNPILILEDDAKFLFNKIPPPPLLQTGKWDMLYLGGTVLNKLEDNENENENNNRISSNWLKVSTWTTHAYIINMTNEELIKSLLKAGDGEFADMELDRYYAMHIHQQFNCFMIYPKMMVIQREGYSDIEKCDVNYDFMQQSLDGFQKPEYTKNDKNEYILKLPTVTDEDLPYVTLITPTFNRRKIFSMALRNFMNFNYPASKLEWIIVEENSNSNSNNNNNNNNNAYETVKDILPPRDKRIKYIDINTDKNKDKQVTIAQKRNIAVLNATHDIILHFDDDDYYPPESVLVRVKMLMKYPQKQCVGSSQIGVYDIINQTSALSSDGAMSLSEATMGYRKSFWQKCGFNNDERLGEYKSFIAGRFDKILDIPYEYVICAISHKTNITDNLRRITETKIMNKTSGQQLNFFDLWDVETQAFMLDMRQVLMK